MKIIINGEEWEMSFLCESIGYCVICDKKRHLNRSLYCQYCHEEYEKHKEE
jgi:hypothetical protein